MFIVVFTKLMFKFLKSAGGFKKPLNNHLVTYPSPGSFNFFWSLGSLLGIMLGVQICTGILCAMYYCPQMDIAFDSVMHLMRNISGGWTIRYMHANGASFIFILIYAHMARGLYYRSYRYPRQYVWISGVVIFILMAATAFLGYVLPWGQMSFWGATVITNIISSIPVVGKPIVEWIWGGPAINNATLTRFYSLHYLLPFIIAALAIVHILLLHSVGSSSPTGVLTGNDAIHFSPYYIWKDILGVVFVVTTLLLVVCYAPNMFSHPDNNIAASPTVTPRHIVPEWYFLIFYAILKSIPDKLGGAIFMGLSMLCLFFFPFVDSKRETSNKLTIWYGLSFFVFIVVVCLLGWFGGRTPVSETMIITQCLTLYYFIHILVIIPYLGKLNDKYHNATVDKVEKR